MMKTISKLAAFAVVIGSMFVSAPALADANKEWKKQIVKKISRAHIYPRSAIRREIEGRAMVRVTVDRAGAMTSYDVIEPTGKKALDNVIPKIMSKLSNLPAPPQEVPDANLTFRVPLNWRLE